MWRCGCLGGLQERCVSSPFSPSGPALAPRSALKAAQQLDRPPAEADGKQSQPASRAAAVAKLEQVAADLPAPGGDDAHLLCSPIKLRPQLPELQAHAQAAEQH